MPITGRVQQSCFGNYSGRFKPQYLSVKNRCLQFDLYDITEILRQADWFNITI